MTKVPDILYHGTGILQLAEIIASGYIDVCADDDYDDSGIVGVSLTSDCDVAKKFAAEAKERDWQGIWNSPVEDGVVICLDGKALANMVFVSSVTWDASSAESEYRTHGRVYDPLRFVTSIDVDADALRWWTNEFAESDEHELAASLQDERLLALVGAAETERNLRTR